MDNITTTADFNKILNSCYFHPEREYPSMIIKLRARMAMTLLWQASEITVRNFKFKQKDIRRILIDEMMPEDLDRAIEYADMLNWQLGFYRFALLVLECVIYGDAIVQMEFDLTYGREKINRESEVIKNEAVNL